MVVFIEPCVLPPSRRPSTLPARADGDFSFLLPPSFSLPGRITSILMSRFMLGLQAAISRTSASARSELSGPRATVTSLAFEKVVGSLAMTHSSSFSSYTDDDDEDGEITGGGNPWHADEVVAVPREGSWENPFADVEAASRAGSLTDISVSTRSSMVFS